jgi:hypothetical protein
MTKLFDTILLGKEHPEVGIPRRNISGTFYSIDGFFAFYSYDGTCHVAFPIANTRSWNTNVGFWSAGTPQWWAALLVRVLTLDLGGYGIYRYNYIWFYDDSVGLQRCICLHSPSSASVVKQRGVQIAEQYGIWHNAMREGTMPIERSLA